MVFSYLYLRLSSGSKGAGSTYSILEKGTSSGQMQSPLGCQLGEQLVGGKGVSLSRYSTLRYLAYKKPWTGFHPDLLPWLSSLVKCTNWTTVRGRLTGTSWDGNQKRK